MTCHIGTKDQDIDIFKRQLFHLLYSLSSRPHLSIGNTHDLLALRVLAHPRAAMSMYYQGHLSFLRHDQAPSSLQNSTSRNTFLSGPFYSTQLGGLLSLPLPLRNKILSLILDLSLIFDLSCCVQESQNHFHNIFFVNLS